MNVVVTSMDTRTRVAEPDGREPDAAHEAIHNLLVTLGSETNASRHPVCPATAHSKDAPLFDEDQLYSLAELL